MDVLIYDKVEVQNQLNINKLKWKLKDEKIHRSFAFKDFEEAFDFMSQVAMYVNKINHHPEWCNTYNKVEIKLTTHDFGGGISNLDIKLALEIDNIALKYTS